MSKSGERKIMLANVSRTTLFTSLSCLSAAQFIIAIAIRWKLRPQAGLSGLLRTYAREDIVVIGSLSALFLIMILVFGRKRSGRLFLLLFIWLISLIKIIFLAINHAAIIWIRSPITLPWLQMVGFGEGETPFLMLSSIASTSIILRFLAAIALPFVLMALVVKSPLKALAEKPQPVMIFTAFCAVVMATGVPAKPPQKNDASSSPVLALWRSFEKVDFETLRSGSGDGQTSDYAQRPATPASPVASKPDIIVVVLESVGAKAVFDNLQTLPTLAGLARNGTVFPNASVDVAASSHSMFSLIFSNHPRVAFGFKPRDAKAAFPEPFLKTLRRAGYSTNFVQGGDFTYQDTDSMLDIGDAGPRVDFRSIACTNFDKSGTKRAKFKSYMPNRCVFDEFERWFTAQRSPRAAIIWPVYTHFPYGFEERELAAAGSKEAYLKSIEAVDEALGKTLARLGKQGVRPIVIIVGDHGEAFGEHDVTMHGQTIFQEEIGIPMILSGPGINAGKIDQRLAQIVDIAPTITALAGAGRPCGWQGLSLLGPEKRNRAFSFALLRDPTVGFREGNQKFVLDVRDGTTIRYDLASDPGEHRPKSLDKAQAKVAWAAIAGWTTYNEKLYKQGNDRCLTP